MTDKAYDNAVANTFIPWAELIREDTNYNIEVDSFDLKKMRVYEDGRVYYSYSISLRVFFSDEDNVAMSVDGDIVMIEENDKWKVDSFKANNASYRDLGKLLMPLEHQEILIDAKEIECEYIEPITGEIETFNFSVEGGELKDVLNDWINELSKREISYGNTSNQDNIIDKLFLTLGDRREKTAITLDI